MVVEQEGSGFRRCGSWVIKGGGRSHVLLSACSPGLCAGDGGEGSRGDCSGRLEVLCAVTPFWAPLPASLPAVPSEAPVACWCQGRRMGAALEKPAEAAGRQSAHCSRGWEVHRRRLKPGRPQDVGSHRGLVGICHLSEARRPALLPAPQLREGDPEHRRKQPAPWGSWEPSSATLASTSHRGPMAIQGWPMGSLCQLLRERPRDLHPDSPGCMFGAPSPTVVFILELAVHPDS